MHKPESVLEYETYKIIREFEIQIGHQILAKSKEWVMADKKEREKERINWKSIFIPTSCSVSNNSV